MEKYFKFDSVATRSEYWGVTILGGIAAFILAFIGAAIMAAGSGASMVFGGILLLATLVAAFWLSIATAVRRCRDAGINVWWAAAICIPYLGWIVSIVLGCLKTDAQSA